MQVLILGGGTIGAAIAKMLCSRHSVTLVDSNPEVTRTLDSDLDIRVVTGSASQSSVLFQAGVTTADICLALTGNDEVNIVGASLAKGMGTPHVAARVYSQIFRDLSTFDYRAHFKIDRLLSIENLTAMELACEIREPGAMLIEHFANGEIEMQNVILTKKSDLLGIPLGELKMPRDVRIGTINRDGKISIASAADTIELGDRVTLFGLRAAVEAMKRTLLIPSLVKQRVIIAGGGEIGYHLAQLLEERNYKITVFESDRSRCDFLADQLRKSTIVFGDASRKTVLEEENLGESDIFVACIGDDENNIMSCVEARELGVKTLLAVINRPDYAEVIGKLGISQAISPQTILSRQVEGFMHEGALIFQNPYLLGGDINIVELEVPPQSELIGKPLHQCGLPQNILLIAFIRENGSFMPNADTVIKEKDILVAIVQSGKIQELVEKLTPHE